MLSFSVSKSLDLLSDSFICFGSLIIKHVLYFDLMFIGFLTLFFPVVLYYIFSHFPPAVSRITLCA